MQKVILLLPLLCLLLCSADDLAEGQEVPEDYEDQDQPSGQEGADDPIVQPSDPPKAVGVQVIYNSNDYPCPGGYTELKRDTQLFNAVVCVKTCIKKIKVVEGDCPAGTAPIPDQEVGNNIDKYCKLLGKNDVARIGFLGRGSLGGSAWGCPISNFNPSDITLSMCAEREIHDIKIVPVIDLCGPGQVLVTPQEAIANQEAYCALLGVSDVIRLANGGYMVGRGYGCGIGFDDRVEAWGALCRNLKQ